MMLLVVLLCALVGGVFFASALPKLRHPKGFVLTVIEYRVLPYRLSRLYGRIVPPLEALIALLLIGGVAVRVATLIAALLLASFLVAVGVNMVRGRDLDCHCFGAAARRKVGWGLLAQDAALMGAAIAIATLSPGWLTPASWSALRLGRIGWSGWPGITPIVSGIGLVGCGLAICRILALQAQARIRTRGSARTSTRRGDHMAPAMTKGGTR